jgi:F0F1-type ATP synthase membrane subunit c/vacuolar-type H+-ATPase subunit K
MSMAQEGDGENTRIRHPNREKSSSQVTKAFVALVLVASAVLVGIVTIGGWNSLQGAQIVSILYIIVYLVMAYFVMRWVRGVLPLAAALAVGLGVFAAIAAGGWFDRAKPNYADPALPPRLLGTIVILIGLVQIILIIAAMVGFQQQWNIEVEESVDEDDDGGRQGYGGAQPQPAGA